MIGGMGGSEASVQATVARKEANLVRHKLIPAGTRILKDPVVTGTLDDPEILGTTSAGSPAPGPAGTP